ncbi:MULTISPECIES: hypothetical protein, partial [unclassified Pedobacter]|jgi:hypothetical protein|uniref:hypothetical protein n=1 Tax=unclassified Pedobacter TaxID=2628915 RepID=UPI000D372DFE
MHKQLPITVKGYYYQTMMKTAYMWLPVFAIVILICSFFEKLRFVLYPTVVAATYTLIINQLKKKSIQVCFENDEIELNGIRIPISDIEEYYISLPLNELLMLRLKTKCKSEAVFLEKESKEAIEIFFSNVNIKSKKNGYDTYLKYSHLILPFAGLIICAVVYKLYNYIFYAVN